MSAQKGKVYLTTIDKNLQYMGEQPLKKLQLPARSVATITTSFPSVYDEIISEVAASKSLTL